LREIYDEGGDLVSQSHQQRLNMDFDFKCRIDPHSIRTLNIAGEPREFFNTLPWRDLVDYENCQVVRASFPTEEKRVLATEADVKHFMGLVDAQANLPGTVYHSHEGGGLGDALKMVCRAIVHNQWNLSKCTRSYRERTQWFKAKGFEVTEDTFKKAKSRNQTAEDHTIELTGETWGLQKALQTEFPDFDYNTMYTAIPQKDRDSEIYQEDKTAKM